MRENIPWIPPPMHVFLFSFVVACSAGQEGRTVFSSRRSRHHFLDAQREAAKPVLPHGKGPSPLTFVK
jgi:hypothetical protein